MPPSSSPSLPPAPPETARTADACAGWRVERVDATGSTNADLLAAFADAAAPIRPRLQALPAPLSWQEACTHFPPVARRARRQSAGRGRLGRPWVSTPGNSLLFSLGIVMPRPLSALSGLSLAVGVAVLDGLRRLPLTQPGRLGLKWPNDILLDDAKLGGILIESAASAPHATALVIGIGLNLRGDIVLATPPADAPGTAPALRPAVLASVLPADETWIGNLDAPTGVPSSDTPEAPGAMDALPHDASDALPEAALAGILAALDVALARFAAEGLGPFRDRWWADHRFAARAVSILDHGREQLRGTAVGIDAAGRLLIAPDAAGDAPRGPLQAVTAGDVSLRLAPDATVPSATPSSDTDARA
ncbi:biotin--[acetyl-CoA-carboxylase] ligase [Robbsia sp. Bb-Pol-6]|uniref:biotin--[biotin carboxyl-carrier protein] ligase n=2 Tax=Robbsia betulipollinis TaxID=2981849 RepID=A0ABT3ZRG8_9BURK|nr:biotin--[acetyl-CoA-carboxylase] ligase [Robbsia betulipollinis]